MICFWQINLIKIIGLTLLNDGKILLEVCAETEVNFHFEILKIFELVVAFVFFKDDVKLLKKVPKDNFFPVLFGDF
jgi:hypothetical protein